MRPSSRPSNAVSEYRPGAQSSRVAMRRNRGRQAGQNGDVTAGRSLRVYTHTHTHTHTYKRAHCPSTLAQTRRKANTGHKLTRFSPMPVLPDHRLLLAGTADRQGGEAPTLQQEATRRSNPGAQVLEPAVRIPTEVMLVPMITASQHTRRSCNSLEEFRMGNARSPFLC